MSDMKNKILKIFLVLSILITNVEALIEVDITRGNLNPLPVAVSPLFVDKTSEQKISRINKNSGTIKKF